MHEKTKNKTGMPTLDKHSDWAIGFTKRTAATASESPQAFPLAPERTAFSGNAWMAFFLSQFLALSSGPLIFDLLIYTSLANLFSLLKRTDCICSFSRFPATLFTPIGTFYHNCDIKQICGLWSVIQKQGHGHWTIHSFLFNRITVLARSTGTQLAATTQLWVIMFWIIRWREESKQAEEAILGAFCTNKHTIVTQLPQCCQAK